jgi:LPS export ABC transporter protein LptC
MGYSKVSHGRSAVLKHGQVVKKILKYGVVVGFIALLSFFLCGRGFFDSSDEADKSGQSPGPSPSTQPENAVEFQVTKLISRKDNIKYWQLLANRIKVNQDNKKGDAREVDCTFFDEKGKPYISLKAPGADIDMNSQSLYFRGRVKARMADGDTMEVAKLVWDGKKKRLFGYKSVTLTRVDAVLKGERMIGDPSHKYVEILGHVDVVWRTDKAATAKK